MTKQIFMAIGFLISLNSCEEVIDVDVPTADPRLVIDATFNRFFDPDDMHSEGIIRLSLSAPFFADIISPALGATVEILDPENNRTYTFRDDDNDGNYFANFVPEFDTPYTLTIAYEGEIYSATERMMPTGKILKLEEGSGGLFNPDDKEIVITISDAPGIRNFYYLNLDKGNFLTSDDEFYDGNPFTFSYFYENLVIGDILNIQLFGSDERFNNFFNILQAQSGQDGGGSGGPFATPPATVRGNIINITNPEHYPFGYFQISEGNKQSIEITK